jgi:hypothetical protein
VVKTVEKMYGGTAGPASFDGPASFEGFEFEGLELPQAIAAIATRAMLHSLVILNGALLKTDSME